MEDFSEMNYLLDGLRKSINDDAKQASFYCKLFFTLVEILMGLQLSESDKEDIDKLNKQDCDYLSILDNVFSLHIPNSDSQQYNQQYVLMLIKRKITDKAKQN